MKDILQHINSIDGVIGSALFNNKGAVLAHAFPPLIDLTALKAAASLMLECSHGLQISETLDHLDLRFADGRIIVKAFPGAVIFLLCANSINLKVLWITLNLATKKLEALLPAESAETADKAVVATPDTADGLLRMNISHLANKEASASFDSLGMVAVSQPTSLYIADFYKTPFKKLTLTNSASGASGTFPVMVMKDMDLMYDGSVVIGPGIEKKLKVSEGDKLEVRIG